MLYPHSGILSSHGKKEVVVHATTWTNLENIMLKEEARHKGHVLYDSIYRSHLD